MPLKNCLVWVIKERFGKIAIYTLQNPTAKLHKISMPWKEKRGIIIFTHKNRQEKDYQHPKRRQQRQKKVTRQPCDHIIRLSFTSARSLSSASRVPAGSPAPQPRVAV